MNFFYCLAVTVPRKVLSLRDAENRMAGGARLVDGSFSDHRSLVEAVKQADVVICAMSGVHFRSHNLLMQLKLVEAIKEAGNVKRFLPSEFGMDPARMGHALSPGRVTFDEKMAVRWGVSEVVEQGQLEYVPGVGTVALPKASFSGPHDPSVSAPMAVAASVITQTFNPFLPKFRPSTCYYNAGRKPRSISTHVLSSAASLGEETRNRFWMIGIPAPGSVRGSRFRFFAGDRREMFCSRRVFVNSAGSQRGSTETSPASFIVELLRLVIPLGVILATDKLLKRGFVSAAIKFPSALFGMFSIFAILIVLDSITPAAATGVLNFFQPALLFIQRWLPLFYVPSLVVLPLSVKDIPTASGLKILFIIVGGWLASLSVAGFTAITVRNLVQTEMTPAEPMPKPSPFSSIELWSWSGIFFISFASAVLYPTMLGTAARTCLPFLLASTILGYIFGSGLPSDVRKLFHPIICCALSADLAAFAYGQLSGSGLNPVLGNYLTKSVLDPGAGDVLMGFLGSVILSFAFSMFQQRKLVKRHAAEIFTSVIISTLFSLYSTALLGRFLGLDSSLTVSILPRCVTVALALSITSFFEGTNSSLTAAVVVLTGLVGANFVQATLDKLGFRDPIARGIATASSAHGLGTAALSAKEPEALPFCAIAYALTGIFGSVICAVPAVRQSLLAVVG
ncbi:hypothetical protein M569_10955 [Genlisea aurea]|uniref:NmrA-like domain-containing protein n=1 Tax=Genlisea aurea TaxID=192259 RepID=S8CAA0_9LAMI|nr:hypothetical protein M569_10955 [Genlisea aurea]